VPIAMRAPARVVVPVALVFAFAGYVAVAFATESGSLAVLIGAFASLGAGIGAAETVSNELILSSAPAAKAGAASAVSETAYELGAVLGTAVLGGVLTALYRAHLVVPVGVPDDVAAAARETLAGAFVTALIGAALVVVAAVVAATTLGSTRSAGWSDH
jgi:MFS transporter, DHA2 family, multidrug resistance protein